MRRVPYAEASRALLRDSVLDAMRELLGSRDWSSITLADVARAAGISRQTIYNEFGSRHGLAQGYALRLADRLVDAVEDAIYANVGDVYAALLQGFRAFFADSAADRLVDAVEDAIYANVGDVYAALLQGFRAFFADSAADPLVISLLTGVAKPDLLQIITTDSGPIITHCSARLTSSFVNSWMRASEEDSGMLARAIVRLAMSYVSMPPEADHDVAADLARLMTPAAERYGELRDDAGVWGPRRSEAIEPGRADTDEWARRGTTGEPGEADQ